MNLPNKLTLSRVILVPFFMLALMLPESVLSDTASRIVAAAIFLVTALTDMADGKIARKYGLVTDFGKFLDPLADKFMIITALLGATAKYDALRPVLVWVTLLVVFRELAVTSLRLLASSKQTVIAAGMSGKIKTVTQCVTVMMLLLEPVILPFAPFNTAYPITLVCIAVMTFFTVYSGIEYFVKYKKFLAQK